MNKFATLASAAAFAIAVAAPASALVVTFTLNDEFSGADTPSGTFTATFNDTLCGADCVRLTLSATGPDTDEFVDEWLFNFVPESSLGSLLFTPVSGVLPTSIGTGADAFNANGGNSFDIRFDFPQPNASRFNVGDPNVVIDISGLVGLTAANFDHTSDAPRGNLGGNHSAAHIQGIGPDAEGSGWITDTNGGGPPGGVVPEPGSLVLLGAALAALGLVRRRRTD